MFGNRLQGKEMKVVYTCITGEKDRLKDQPTHPDWKFICYTDRDNLNSITWEVRKIQKYQKSSRKTARWHKINSHLLFPDATAVLWIDGSINMKHNPQYYYEKYGSELSVLPSLCRSCLYEEAEACIEFQCDNIQTLREQVQKYSDEGIPRNLGMIGTGFMIREHNDNIKRFNELWWKEIEHHSIRDQVSFPYVAYKTSTEWKTIPLKEVIINRHER